MIKAEDLRIGDIVIVSKTGCKIPKGTVCRVTAIETESMLFDDRFVSVRLIPIDPKCKQISWYDWSKNISPIPLTPEILEKNGWKKRTEGWYFMMISKYMYLSVEFGYDNGIRVSLKRATDGLYVKLNIANNVHELQHILWALGKDAELKV